MEQCEASLKRLGMDYIDIYYCHRYDEQTPTDETLRALDDLITQGKIIYGGVSEWSAAQIKEAAGISKRLNLHPLVSNQPIYNMFERYIEDEVLKVSEEEGIGQIVFSPLAQGILTGKYKPGTQIPQESRAANDNVNGVINSYLKDNVLECVQDLEGLAQELGISLAQLSLAWVLRKQGVSSALIGASRPEQIEENVKAVQVNLQADVLEEIEKTLKKVEGFAPLR
jgi:aryl-alcohol dehydrogenase-like predicted oxidoreductase